MATSVKDKRTWKEILLDYALYIILGIMIIGVIIADRSFVSMNNFWKILAQASTRGIMALGVAGLIVLAGTDLQQDVCLAAARPYLPHFCRALHTHLVCIRRLRSRLICLFRF